MLKTAYLELKHDGIVEVSVNRLFGHLSKQLKFENKG